MRAIIFSLMAQAQTLFCWSHNQSRAYYIMRTDLLTLITLLMRTISSSGTTFVTTTMENGLIIKRTRIMAMPIQKAWAC